MILSTFILYSSSEIGWVRSLPQNNYFVQFTAKVQSSFSTWDFVKLQFHLFFKKIKSKVKSDGSSVVRYFLDMFYQRVEQANNVFLLSLQMLKLITWIRIGLRFNSSDQDWKHTLKLLPFTLVSWSEFIFKPEHLFT